MTRGLTLVEVMVGVVLTGIAALLAHLVVVSVADGARAIERGLGDDARAAVWRTRVRQQLQLLSPDVRAGGFRGDSVQCEFGTLETGVPGPQRWMLGWTADTIALRRAGGAPVAALGGVTSLRMEYLESPGETSPWLVRWESPASAPVAVRLRWRHGARPNVEDTLVLLTGARG